ncbi:hypothetical protein FEZ51_02110 [Pediococcus stilesii]|uniref:Head decoration protein n=1 Tax=Pediococcus stilesii TaxID=331679 RepID=A0A5R9BXM0_9LACO|nr:hypothetical protein [Pediococcus stilesii]TLQ05474.1 hypothetical protein FEZ51_02110 [Pediococcus stilesii]
MIETFGGTTQVLGNVMNKVAFPVQLNDAGITADANGKKIIPAGTPVGGAVDALQDETAVLGKVDDETAQGILEHDVDVTSGQGNGTLIVWGFVNELRIKDVTISDAVKTALKGRVTFIKRNPM